MPPTGWADKVDQVLDEMNGASANELESELDKYGVSAVAAAAVRRSLAGGGGVGPQGPEGPQGEQGPPGEQGETGPPGPQGVLGADGPPGQTGPKGDQGNPGVQGEPGVQGIPGPKGDDGDTGPQGQVGPQGDTGDTGPQGGPGIQGEQGPIGLTGDTGPEGPEGPQGIPGPPGEDGTDGAPGASGVDIGLAWPVGSVFLSVVATNPATLLGVGTWTQIARDRFLVGQGVDTDFDTAEETGGAKTVTLTEAQMPSHTHVQQRFPTATGALVGFTVDTSMSGTPAAANATGATGGGAAHPNVPPYFVVYVWKRTA